MLRLFKILGKLEGTSLLILLFVAVPLKHILGHGELVRIVGMAHGLLFIGYVALATALFSELNWTGRTLRMAYFLSCVPGGTFYFEKKFLA